VDTTNTPASAIASLCSALQGRVDEIGRTTVDLVRAQFAVYTHVPYTEHLAAVVAQHRDRLDLLPSPDEMGPEARERTRALAAGRARQGVPIDVLIGAYHLGDQVLWRAFRKEAGSRIEHLPSIADAMLTSLHLLTTNLAAAHAVVDQAERGHRRTVSQRLAELMWNGHTDAEARTLADVLGLGEDRRFVALVWHSDEATTDQVTTLSQRFPHALVATHGKHGVCVIDEAEHEAAGAVLGTMAARAGIGHSRSGLVGAASSMQDALLALGATSATTSSVRLADEWLVASLLAQHERLDVFLEPLVPLVHANSTFAHTVVAFARHGFSVRLTAAALHVHANTVSYRLDRWAALTGLNPRSLDGVSATLAAIRRSTQPDRR
jgi:hypothetical protein